MIPSIFKAYDIRGRYPEEINEAAVTEIVKVLAKYFRKGKIVVGHDARLSSPSLYKAVLQSLKIENLKLKIEAVGLVTTPMLYFLVTKLKATGGIMITASHNPKEYNGLKVVGPNVSMISGKEVWELMQLELGIRN
jgi:phosphomannomutase